MSERTTPAVTAGQQLALDQLRQITGSDRGGVFLTHVDTAPAKAPTGAVEARISVGCADLPRAEGGLRLRSEEPVTLYIPPDFPFKVPLAYTRHTCFAGAPHVVWAHFPCLYRSTATEWDPADGMYGFITRLLDWFKAAVAGELDAPGEPLHPPHAVGDYADGLLVVRRDAPIAENDEPWLGAALLHRVSADRSDVAGWLPFGPQWPQTLADARAAAQLPDDAEVFLAPAVITADHLAFEYPDTARSLITALARGRITARMVLGLIGMAADHNRRLRTTPDRTGPDDKPHPPAPVHLLLGTPSRGTTGHGPRRTHLVAWHLPDFAAQLTRHAVTAYIDRQLPELGDELMQIGEEWLDTLTTRWISLYEARPEVTVRRDHHTPAAWLHGKRILVLGAGALGAPAADICARAGAAHITVVDSADVHPGIHARQPYTDADIGHPKADVLAGRLNEIDPHTTRIEPVAADITRCLPALDVHSFDLILDCTANRVVRAYLERARRTDPTGWPHLATVMIGHQATRGIAALSPHGATGGGTDVLCRTALTARTDPTRALADLVEDFFPTEPRTELFQPEPGCSDATFTGSAADVTALAGQLMTGILHALNAPAEQHTMAALTVRAPSGPTDPQPAGPRWLTWPNDTTITDDATGYDVRIAPAALAEMRAEARRGARVRGPRVETGGMLLGAVDDSTGIIYVDEATGPPPDSLLAETYFQHGLDGVTRHLAARRTATSNTSRFLGLWHTHPHSPAQPSATDRTAMQLLTLPLDDAPARALVLIAGGPQPVWEKWLTTGDGPDLYARLATRTTAATTPPVRDGAIRAPRIRPLVARRLRHPPHHRRQPPPARPTPIGRRPPMTRTLGLALSGGGSRAAAFHLGCLRALHDRDLLDRIRVVSCISGGSLLAALWAYGPSDFTDFDAQATDLLRSGLQLDIARQAFKPSAVARNLTAAARASARGLLTRGTDVSVARPANRTDALAAVLARKAFATATMADATHPGLDVVLPATDLATTNAVRFGSTRSGCSRYGTITEPIHVTTAVAASAAYPALLPALERTFTFQHRDGHSQQHTVLLTDGGVYDNLGLSVLEPGRSPHHTQHVYDVPFIISCDAGLGELALKTPHFMLGRLSRSFATVHRKAQDSARARLHEWAASGRIDGFALAYLGMKDDRLPAPLADLVPRSAVASYPTNFAAMARSDFDAITTRGEQLMRTVLPMYLPPSQH